MSDNLAFYSNTENYHQSSSQLERPRLHKLLKSAIRRPLVVVCAGAGYGKTREVYSFLKDSATPVTWLQLSERDNVESHFWEKYTHMITKLWPESGTRFVEIGFPKTDEAFAKYLALRNAHLSGLEKCILVYDDFHLLNNPSVLRFFDRAAESLPANATAIIISRTMPDAGIIGMMIKEDIFIINEDSLCFTEDEIAKYFFGLTIHVTRQDVRDIYEDTQGWAFAINLIGRSLLRDMKYKRNTLDVMKENIFKLIESELANNISPKLFRFLLRIALVDNHSAILIRSIAGDEAIIREMEQLNAYIRYDFYQGSYVIHHLLLDFLRQKQHELTEYEIRDTYQKTGEWCENDDYLTDALSYYEKAGDYDAILRIVHSFNMQVPLSIAGYTADLLERIPEGAVTANPLYPAMRIKLKMGLGLLEEATELAQRYTEEYTALPPSPGVNRALSEIYCVWAYLRIVMSPHTDKYDFDEYFKKQREYYDLSPFETSGASSLNPEFAYAILIGTNRAGAPEEYIEALSRAIPHAAHVLNGNLTGLDDLARGELCLMQLDINKAEQHLIRARDNAHSKGQYIIYSRALSYLMIISLCQGNIDSATIFLRQIEDLLDVREYAVRYEAFDIASSHYYLALCQPEQIPEWLKADFSPYTHSAYLENYANLIKAQHRYQTRRYNELLAFLDNVRGSQIVLFCRVVLVALEALTLYQLKRKDEAFAVLAEAHRLAGPHNIVALLTQYAKDMRTLTSAALKSEDCPIPKDWLHNINRKASAFAKRQAHMISYYKTIHGIEDQITLTKRETEILKELTQGLSRSEIAASQNISINTVKMVISIIYEKLRVTNLLEAIRIAIENKII
ncbi:MAG: LuxR C-terminal-related transcriptional regulator [Oscillospiraceae bacterium]|nr:LuxR C-terminal-related transcriptional regulator [Oscillospiraceae bacterium]